MSTSVGLQVGVERASGMQSVFNKEFRPVVRNTLVLGQPGLSKAVTFPMNAGGKTVRVFNNRKIAKVTTEFAEVIDAPDTNSYPAGIAINLDFLEFTMQRYANYAKISKEAGYYIVGDEIEHAKEVLQTNAAESIDNVFMRNWATRCIPYRADLSTTYMKTGFVTTATDTTHFTDSARTDGTDFFKGGWVIFVGNAGSAAYATNMAAINWGQAFQVTTNTNVGAFTFGVTLNAWAPAAFPKNNATNDSYFVAVNTSLTATMAASVVRKSVQVLDKFAAPRFKTGKMAGYFAGVIDQECKADMESEAGTNTGGYYSSIFQYTDAKPLMTGILGAVGGVMFFMTSQPYREASTGVQSDTGAIHRTMIFGEDAYLRSKLNGPDPYGINFYVRNPEQLAQPIPSYSTAGWESFVSARENQGAHAIAVLSAGGAASLI